MKQKKKKMPRDWQVVQMLEHTRPGPMKNRKKENKKDEDWKLAVEEDCIDEEES